MMSEKSLQYYMTIQVSRVTYDDTDKEWLSASPQHVPAGGAQMQAQPLDKLLL